jgi:hypothetical protein
VFLFKFSVFHIDNHLCHRPWSSARPSKAVLLSVLAITHRFMMDAGVEWAIRALDSLDMEDSLTPAHRLQLSFRYEIKQWILPAVSGLVDRQAGRKLLRLISNDDVEQMGVRTYTLIVRGVEAIQAARTSVAITPSAIDHCAQCQINHEDRACTRAWHDFWVATIPLIVLAPDHPKPLHSLVDFLKKTDIRNVRNACKILTLSQFERTDILKIETTVKDRVAAAIWDLHQKGVM